MRDVDSRPLTIPEIVARYDADLQPTLAIQHWKQGNWRPFVVSPVISQVIFDGKVKVLAHRQGRHAAVYARVSMMKHGLDGTSTASQIECGVFAAVKAGFAFRIYSDKGISGFYGTDDPAMIKKVRAKQARFYHEAFEEAVLANAETWNTAKEIATMRAWLEFRCNAILIGEKEALKEWDEKQTDRDWKNVDLIFAVRFQHHAGVRFRPALHALVDDIESMHSIFITDPDRLSRNRMLFVILGELLVQNDVQVFSSSGAADWLTGDDIKDHLMGAVIGNEAEAYIKKTKVRVLRGLVRTLREGRPHSALPSWLDRRDKYAWLRPKEVLIVRQALALAQRKDRYYGEARIATKLHNEGVRPTRLPGHAIREQRRMDDLPEEIKFTLHADTIGYWLRNPWLYGCQVMFGREWEMRSHDERKWPRPDGKQNPLALMSRDEFWTMQKRRQRENPENRGRPTANPKLANRIIRCWCGYIVRFRAGDKKNGTPDRYRCTCPPNERKVHAGYHALFAVDELENFLLDLVAYGGSLFHEASDQEAGLDRQEEAARAELESQRLLLTTKADLQLKGVDHPHDSVLYQDLVSHLVSGEMKETQEAYDAAINRIGRARQRYASIVALRNTVDTTADVRSLPKDKQMVRIQGMVAEIKVAPDLTSMTPYDHNEEALPPIPLRPERSLTSDVPVCHLPASIGEYILSVEIPLPTQDS